jgi:hypothetical protein
MAGIGKMTAQECASCSTSIADGRDAVEACTAEIST